MSDLSEGEVQITLNGESLVLRPTLAAFQNLSRMHDGLAGVRDGLAKQNLDTVCNVLRHGLGLDDKGAKHLPAKVYKNGVSADLIIPLINFIGILGNGGKPIAEATADDDGADAGN